MADLMDKIREKLSRENLLFIFSLITAIWASIQINDRINLVETTSTTLANIWAWTNLIQLSIFHIILSYFAYLILKLILKPVFIGLIYATPNDIDLDTGNNIPRPHARVVVTKLDIQIVRSDKDIIERRGEFIVEGDEK